VADDQFLTAAQPFAWTHEDGTGWVDTDPESLNPRRVTQCALSRLCGVCAEPLGRPVVFVGTPEEVHRNSFHAPPLHEECARGLVARVARWQVVATAAFEYVRPGRDDLDKRPRFEPSVLI
jgi:hypothetical protein